MQKTPVYLLGLVLILSLGFGIGWFLHRPQETTQAVLNTNQCDVGPLFYQVRNSVSDEFSKMDEYPTKDRYYGKPASVDFTGAPNAKRFYTMVTQGALLGPNVAGHYTIVQIAATGYGYHTFIIDARTGKVILDDQEENSRWRYTIDSNLIIAEGIANPAFLYGPPDQLTTSFPIQSKLYLLENGELKEAGNLRWTFGTRE